MRFHVLGPVRVTDRGDQLSLGGRQQRLILALLLARAGESLSADRLVEDIWEDQPPNTARKTLHGYIHHLRSLVGDTIRSDDHGYQLHLGRATFDARDFERAAADSYAAEESPADISERLAAALAMWKGTAYADVDHALALKPEVTRLTELRLNVLEMRIDADLDMGGSPDLLGELQALTSDHPLRERFAAQLMRAFYLAGRQTEALRTYDRTRDYLAEHVGLEPSQVLVATRDRVLQNDPTLSAVSSDERPFHAVKGYELRGVVASDRHSRTELAYQTSVGRQVSINIIEAPIANETSFVASFAEEIGAVARLAHPHLVPISDFWREPDRAYIVSPWFEGGSLTERRWTAASFEQVGSALAYAHREGMAHGGITASDVVFDHDGNAYLGGFSAGLLAGDEARRGDRLATAVFDKAIESDISRLTSLLSEHAPASWLGSDEMRQLIERGTGSDRGARHTRVDDLLRDFRRALGRDVTAMAGSQIGGRAEVRNPFKGLRAFQESDARDFFGRQDLVASVLETLDRVRFVAVVGASGGGKSSLVKAGVIPALKERAAERDEKVLVAEMYPGSYPFEELAAALTSVATSGDESLQSQLAEDDRGLLRVIKRILPEDVDRVVLVIDQFEELFSIVSDETTRSLFIANLMSVLVDEVSPVAIVVTLRADYFNRPLEYAALAQAVEAALIPVTPLSVDGLGRAVSGPARSVGLDLEPGLISQIVSDVEGQPGGLPLLQYSLTEMFEARDSNVLTIDTYRRIGGVAGALAGRAEALFNELGESGQVAARQCFLRLVSVAADKNDLRRRVRRSELTSLPVDQDALEEVIRLFGASRLLSFDRDAQTRGPTVEVAHEALIREWGRLRAWIDSRRGDLIHHRALVIEVDEWLGAGRDESYLLRGGRLDEFESWSRRSEIKLTGAEHEFLEASRSLRRAEELKRARERRRLRRGLAIVSVLAVAASVLGVVAFQNSQIARQKSELAEQGQRAAELSADQADQAAADAIASEEKAVESANEARAEALAAASATALGADPELALLLAIESLELNHESRSASQALNGAYQFHRTTFQLSSPDLWGGSISPDGSLLALATLDELQVMRHESAVPDGWTWPSPEGYDLFETYFSADGQSIVAGLAVSDGACAVDRWIVLDAGSGAVIADNTFGGLTAYGGGPAQNGPFVAVDRPMILGEGGAEVCQSNPQEGRLITVDLIGGAQEELAFAAAPGSGFTGIPSLSASGDVLAVGSLGGGLLLGRADSQELSVPSGLTSLNSDGSLVLAGNDPLELWSVGEGEKLREYKADFRIAWFSPSETMVYGATWDGRILVFDLLTGDLIFELRGHQGLIRTVQMTDDEDRIASIADDGVRVWDVGTPLLSTASQIAFPAVVDEAPAIYQTPDVFVTEDLILAKRGVCVVLDCDLTQERPLGLPFDETTLYDAETGIELSTYTGGLLAVSPDGKSVALQQTGRPVDVETDGATDMYVPYDKIVIADLQTGAVITEMEGFCLWYSKGPASDVFVETEECVGYPGPWREYAHFAAFSPDGSLLAMAGESGRHAVWDTTTGEVVWSRDSKNGAYESLFSLNTNVTFTPDGDHILVAKRWMIEVVHLASNATVAVFETEGGAPMSMEFTPDGELFVFNDALLNVHVVDTEHWERIHSLTGQQGQWFPDIALDPTGQLVATAGMDNVSRIWDIRAGEEVHQFTAIPSSKGLRNVEWMDESTVLLGNRTWVVLMTLDNEVLLQNARLRLTRSFTTEECLTYGIEPCPTLDDVRSGT